MPLASRSADRLFRLIQIVHGRNPFYTRKFDAAGIRPAALTFPADLRRLPLTTKQELAADQQTSPPWGTNLTEPLDRYTRYNQTSSTTGEPLRWLDTNESWQWMLDCWKAVYSAARVDAGDRILFPFSFGPFLGFWTAFEAGCQVGAQCIPAGGMSSQARLAMIEALRPTVSLLHADLRVAASRSGIPGAGPEHRSRVRLGAGADRRRRTGRQHLLDARPHREAVGGHVSSTTTALPRSGR